MASKKVIVCDRIFMLLTLSKEEGEKRVSAYYKNARSQYRLFWYSPTSLALHMGFWEDNARSLTDALLQENKFLAETARITRDDLVLDAGCGVGGSSIWIAKHIGAKVIGIANEQGLIDEARRNAEVNKVTGTTTFELQNYNHTNFPSDTFDVVWAIESFDYAPDKRALFEEMYRILKPGGRLVVADFFQHRDIRNRNEELIFDNITTTLAVYQTQWWGEYIPILKELGFNNVREFDKTNAVRPSSKHLYKVGLAIAPVAYMLYPLCFVSRYVSTLVDHWRCSRAMDKAFQAELIKYGVYYAEKPQ